MGSCNGIPSLTVIRKYGEDKFHCTAAREMDAWTARLLRVSDWVADTLASGTLQTRDH